MRICVVALGKIGLPLAVQCAMKGHDVVGADVDASAVATIQGGRAPFPGEANLDDYLERVISTGRLTATTDTTDAVLRSEVVIVVVPLVVDAHGVPEFRAMDAATAAIAAGLEPGTLVSYETTLPVGTTRGRFTPALENGSGLRAGEDLFVCHSPERVFSGRIFADLRRYPKLVGGIDGPSARRAVELYEAILDFDERTDLDRSNGVWDLGSAEAAELAKLAETTYRDVNIALANTFAIYADTAGIDVYEVIAAANSQPFSHIHRPGVAVGGHCIPVYPRFYLAGDPAATVVAAARATNEGMPRYAVDRLEHEVGPLEGRTVAVLGVAYRGGVKESALSGVFGLVEDLQRRGARPVVTDPLYVADEITAMGFEPFELGGSCDYAIVQTDHREYRTLRKSDLPTASVVVDGRNFLDERARADFAVIDIGRGRWQLRDGNGREVSPPDAVLPT